MVYVIAGYTAVTLSMIIGFLVWKFRFVIWSGYVRAEIICEDDDVLTRTFKLKTSDTEFKMLVKGSRDTYHILDDRIYRAGKFRIPKLYYNAHCSEPIDIKKMRQESKVVAARYTELSENTVTRDLLREFYPSKLSTGMAFMLIAAINVVTSLMLGFILYTKLDELAKLHGG